MWLLSIFLVMAVYDEHLCGLVKLILSENLQSIKDIVSSDRSSCTDDGLLLAPTGALVVTPLPLFHITSSRSSKSLYNLLTLLKSLEHLCLYIKLPIQLQIMIDAD